MTYHSVRLYDSGLYHLDLPPLHPTVCELIRLEDQRDEILARIEEIKLKLRQEHNQRLPISRLPAELLSRIFSLSRASKNEHYGRGPFSYKGEDTRSKFGSSSYAHLLHLHLRLELRISHVCQEWRSVAQGTYPLWQTLVVRASRPTAYFKSEVSYVKHYLQCSKTAALNIRIYLASESRMWDKIWPILLLTTHRWQRFSISSQDPSPHRTLYRSLMDISAPNLEDLSVEQAECDDQLYEREDARTDKEEDYENDGVYGGSSLFSRKLRIRMHHPLTVFGGGTPKLTSLRTRGVAIVIGDDAEFTHSNFDSDFEAKSFIMPTLTTLFLHDVVNPCWTSLPYDTIAILVHCPSI
ncbi:hypothetical protein AX16_007196 [Volvariella volvacea WC 439]|nr:hypothetical protein AX16_007196 [Volvariella volvacea WC 439]